MIPKQTPVRNFRPAAPPQTSLFSSLPLAPPRKSASSSSLIRPLCVQSQTLYRNHLRRQVRPRIACCITLPTSSSVPPFPQDLSQEKSFRASRPSSPNLPLPENRTRRKCLVSQSFAAARPLPHRLPSCTARVIFRPAFPQSLSREGKLCAYHLSLETYGFQTAQRDMMTCIAIICGDKAAPRCLLSCTACVIFRPAFPQGLSREGKLCAYHLPLETYGFQTAQRDMMTCIAKKREARFGASLRSVSGGIRTRDLQSRSLTRYPAALQTQSTLLLYLVLRRRARPSFIPACSACKITIHVLQR